MLGPSLLVQSADAFFDESVSTMVLAILLVS